MPPSPVVLDIDALVGLFPGQGGYREGALAPFWEDGDPELREVLAEIDAVALNVLGKDIGTQIFGPDARTPDDPELLQLAVYTVSVGTHRLLGARGVEPALLVGHSMGEFAALVAGGALTVAQGAEMLCHRIAATTGTDGGMLSLGCDLGRVEQILDLAAEPEVVVAVVNGPSQVVVSGPWAGLRRIEAVASALGFAAVRLSSPAPFHNPLMAGVRAEVVKRLSGMRGSRLRTPVYSPILGRLYRDDDDLVGMLGMHLVTRVRFDTAIARLHGAGARIFMEIGAGTTLTGLVRAAHPEVVVLPALDGAAPEGNGAGPAVPMARSGSEPVATDAPRAVGDVPPAAPSEAEVMTQIRTIYAEALEYPEDVLTPDAHLEADLGVDSVKRTELLARVRRHFGIEPSSEDAARVAEYETVGAVAALVTAALEGADGG
ncbi:acyltransferase domain-containing protein [Actinomadura kijaniata]|uniref:acyltransferase domain-containing protein n=1 Tax=Actinomadura kijaniata TaxID=46161 RepID=UPI0014723718|nr:acyltransferase domain-containing protein [Actinomadura kijaniata]